MFNPCRAHQLPHKNKALYIIAPETLIQGSGWGSGTRRSIGAMRDRLREMRVGFATVEAAFTSGVYRVSPP
jgi:hypothetical protein